MMIPPRTGQEAMEKTDWLNAGLDSAEARFLMLTAITHHRFSSPLWGEGEVLKLGVELAEIDLMAARAAIEHHYANRSGRRRPAAR